MEIDLQIEGKPVKTAWEVCVPLLKVLYEMQMEDQAVGGGVDVSDLAMRSRIEWGSIDRCLVFLERMRGDGLLERVPSRHPRRYELPLTLSDKIRLTPKGWSSVEGLLSADREKYLKQLKKLYGYTLESIVAGVTRGLRHI
jgi:hypothetical protein